MRLNNFLIILGADRVTVNDLTATTVTQPTPYLIVSGATGSWIRDRGGSHRFWGFTSHFGDDSDENPYGCMNVYNIEKVNTSTMLALSQSLSAPITGSAQACFLFISRKGL